MRFEALLCAICLFFGVPSSISSYDAHDRPFVSSWMKSGQLGNQLFEVAATLAFAWDHNMEPIFPGLHHTDFNIPINHERIFFRLNSSALPRPIRYTFDQYQNYAKIDIPVRPDQMLRGYFHTWKYFDHRRDEILDIFAPLPEELEYLQTKHEELLTHPLTVAVHVRTFNKKWSKIFPFVGLDYYERAMNLFPADALFVVFSDRINWCKHHFAEFDRPMVFIDDQDHIQDLYLMSLMKHNIIGNSTFSWWGAYLNRNPDKIVVAPDTHLHPKLVLRFKTNKDLKELPTPNMPDWIVLPVDYDYIITPYPADIRDYDAYSKSIDTQ